MTICEQYLRTSLSSFGEKIFKGHVNKNEIFAFFHIQSSAKMLQVEFHYIFNKL